MASAGAVPTSTIQPHSSGPEDPNFDPFAAPLDSNNAFAFNTYIPVAELDARLPPPQSISNPSIAPVSPPTQQFIPAVNQTHQPAASPVEQPFTSTPTPGLVAPIPGLVKLPVVGTGAIPGMVKMPVLSGAPKLPFVIPSTNPGMVVRFLPTNTLIEC